MESVPESILDLFNEGWTNSTLYNTAIGIDPIKNLLDNVEPTGKMTNEKLQEWYDNSVKADNFIKIFDANFAFDTSNVIYQQYKKLVIKLGNVADGNAQSDGVFSNDWNTLFFTVGQPNSINKKLLGTARDGRRVSNMGVTQARKDFQNLASYFTLSTIQARFDQAYKENLQRIQDDTTLTEAQKKGKKEEAKNKQADLIAQEVLKAWSFYLSLYNWRVQNERIKAKAIAEKEKYDPELAFKLITDNLTLRDEEGSRAADDKLGTAITNANAAKAALDAAKFNKQRYLIENIDELSKLSIKRDKDSSSSTQLLGVEQNRILRFTNSKKNAVNKLTGAASGREMFKLPNIQLSKLVPMIKISKVLYNKDMKRTKDIEVEFPTMFMGGAVEAGKLDPLETSITRNGYGIKSFSWEFKGSDPFSVDRDISATLELYFQDFSEFTKKRSNKKGQTYRYVDLIVPLEKDYPQAKAILGDAFQQDIRIQAGWEIPPSLEQELQLAKAMPVGSNPSLKAAKKQAVSNFAGKIASIKASQVDLVLNMLDYSLSFEGNGNGAVTITINYRARIESVGKNRLINVIGATKDELEYVHFLEDEINNTKDAKEKEKIRKTQQNFYKFIKKQASQRYIDRLNKNLSLYWRYINLEEVMISVFGEKEAKNYYKALKSDTFTPENKDGLKETLTQLDTSPTTKRDSLVLVKDVDNIPTMKGDNKPEKIAYTFMGDILQVAMELAAESGAIVGGPQDVLDNLKVALLDFRVGDQTYNLCNLPVEVGILTEFLNNKIGKRDAYTKSFISFARELIAEVLINRIDEYFNLKDGTTRSFKIGYIDMNKFLKPNSERSYNLLRSRDVSIINDHYPKQDFIVIYSDSPVPSDFKIRNGKYEIKKNQDESNGLHHFTMGSTKSIVKNISFDRLDLEYARERRLTMNSEDPYALLANVFNVNISMFGNNFFRPGSYIYVDPKVMGNMGNPYTKGSIANIMGLGGYHIVTGVTHSINLQSYETTIDAVWETSGDGESSFTKLQNKKTPEGKEEKKEDKDKK